MVTNTGSRRGIGNGKSPEKEVEYHKVWPLKKYMTVPENPSFDGIACVAVALFAQVANERAREFPHTWSPGARREGSRAEFACLGPARFAVTGQWPTTLLLVQYVGQNVGVTGGSPVCMNLYREKLKNVIFGHICFVNVTLCFVDLGCMLFHFLLLS